ncbi:hypothetical protein [Rhodococcus jostii]|uniref:hypothetical protein n=1 Tax=Rhodococcus jostii TaxID=132919 RepID=UPI003632B1E7
MGTIVWVSALLPSKQPISRESGPVDEQSDHDLWIDATFLPVADLAEVVFLLRLEIQGRRVVENH